MADHVATITLNRPHRRNAISGRMLQLLSELFAQADDDGDVRVVLLTGAGKGFCSGLDIKDAMAGTGIGGSGGGGGGGVVHADPQPAHRDPPGDGHPGDRGASTAPRPATASTSRSVPTCA